MSSTQLARAIGSLLSSAEPQRQEPKTVKLPRLRLWEVPTRFHCPLVGTCLSIADLERAIRKAGVEWGPRPKDIDIHHAAVHGVSQDCRLSRILNKLLEKRYARFIRRCADCSTSKALTDLWRGAMRCGELPGMFWAIVTHPATDDGLRDTLYGDVHMLSHLNGASHRADLARLSDLEKENAGLHASLGKARRRTHTAIAERDARIRQLEATIARLKARLVDDVGSRFLSDQLDEARRTGARQGLRAERAEARLADREHRLDEYAQDLAALRELLDETRGELALAEKRMQALLPDSSSNRDDLLPRLDGRRVVYIGGRASLTPHMRALVERMDGRFVHHDGGLEDNRAALEEVVRGADWVFCPIDCISHDACQKAKTCCQRSGARFLPLRSAGISSFAFGLEKAVSPEFVARTN